MTQEFKSQVKGVFRDLKQGKISCPQAWGQLKFLPYKNLNFARLDTHRLLRKGFPEVIFCKGKNSAQLLKILDTLKKIHRVSLLTKLEKPLCEILKAAHPAIRYYEEAKLGVYVNGRLPKARGSVLVITAGTADIPVAEEARITLEVMGNRVKRLYDVGVAGIHRILDKRDMLQKARIIIVVAGMEGALASVIAGITARPIIAVPTSVGYGASFKGLSALLTMLNNCAPGSVVVNIDNGFGAAYFASLINQGKF